MINKYYFVADLLPDKKNVKVVFILESPYKAEVENGYPVAGLSGREISFLLNKIDSDITAEIPFGKYLSENLDSRFGIINCSNNPMDIKTYPTDLQSDQFIMSLNRIRKNPKTAPQKRQNITDSETHFKLIDNLKNRIENLSKSNNSILFVTCGNLAKYFVEATQLSDLNKFHIPHPSFNQWRHKKNLENVKKLEKIISQKILH